MGAESWQPAASSVQCAANQSFIHRIYDTIQKKLKAYSAECAGHYLKTYQADDIYFVQYHYIIAVQGKSQTSRAIAHSY